MTGQLMLYAKIIVACSEVQKNQRHTLYGYNAEFPCIGSWWYIKSPQDLKRVKTIHAAHGPIHIIREAVSLPVNRDRSIQVNKCILGTKIDLQSAVPRSSCS
jgi:hypothetical protein